ncbi:hypothetical protein PSTT_06169, partial [Puccinia striiformis]
MWKEEIEKVNGRFTCDKVDLKGSDAMDSFCCDVAGEIGKVSFLYNQSYGSATHKGKKMRADTTSNDRLSQLPSNKLCGWITAPKHHKEYQHYLALRLAHVFKFEFRPFPSDRSVAWKILAHSTILKEK